LENKKGHSNNSLLHLFGSMPPKGSSSQKNWEEIRDESRKQHISKKITSENMKKTGNIGEKGRD